MFLYVKNDYNPEPEWCLPSDQIFEDPKPGVEVLPYPWDDPVRRTQAFKESGEAYEAILFHLAKSLNAVHAKTYPPSYWRILIGYWLMSEVHILYDKFHCLNDARQRWKDCGGVGLSEQDFFRLSDFSSGQIIRFFGKNYQAMLTTQLMQAMQVPFETRRVAKIYSHPAGKSGFKASISRLYQNLSETVASTATIRAAGVGLTPFEAWKIYLQSGLKIQCTSSMPFRPDEVGRPPNEAMRRQLFENYSPQSSFEQLATPIIARNLPTAYLEGYERFRALNLKPAGRVSTWLGGTSWFADEAFKLNAAEAQANGKTIVGMQHGGYYGTALYHPCEAHERKCVDQYFTWGWAEEMEKDIPIASLHLSTLAKRMKRPRGKAHLPKILFVSTSHPRELSRFQSHPLGPQWKAYHCDQAAFLQSLSAELLSILRLRLYPTDYDWSLKQFFEKKVPGIQFDCEKSAIAALANCDLLICDHPATTFLEGLSARIPMVAYWNPDRFEERPAARPAFAALREARILWNDPQSAARWVNQIFPQLLPWWNESDRQRAVAGFVHRYALTHRAGDHKLDFFRSGMLLPGEGQGKIRYSY